jgi:hypothetical protein
MRFRQDRCRFSLSPISTQDIDLTQYSSVHDVLLPSAATSLTMLQKFPKEILELIAKQVCQSHSKDISLMLTFQLSDLGSYRDLEDICEVSKIFYQVSLPYLYKQIVLKPRLCEEREDLDIKLLSVAIDQDYLSSIRDLVVTSRFRDVAHTRVDVAATTKIIAMACWRKTMKMLTSRDASSRSS